ncbi:hypothetical protein FTUN_6054 [Frigoriglobus tundricola]|uniref:Uncharacterized protein n=1 Tax=Frigoriglobus tundricola TaxID=2774151 RepID=A0A6M5YY65_9BACT|nr:hypothetical protein FTUN_6054 [Frigoriglobus tundricola]
MANVLTVAEIESVSKYQAKSMCWVFAKMEKFNKINMLNW